MTPQNLWDSAKTILRGKFIAMQSYLKKQEKHWIDNLMLHLKQLDKEGKKSPKISKKRKIIKTEQKEIKKKWKKQ